MSSNPSGPQDFEFFQWEPVEDDDASVFERSSPLGETAVQPPPVQASDSETASEPKSTGVLSADPPVEQVQPTAAGAPMTTARYPRRSKARWQFDPLFAYIVLVGLSFGLTPLATQQPNGRYSLLWTLMALVVIAARVMDDGVLEVRLQPVALMWGAIWGLLVGFPLLLVGPGLLAEVSHRMFVGVPDGVLFQTLVFVMATTETAFFRGLIQSRQTLAFTALLASGWSILLFFPTLDVIGYPLVALVAGIFLVLLNFLYSYIRQRNGVAAAWVAQTVVSLAWLFIPRL